jgi:hypothetical protein
MPFRNLDREDREFTYALDEARERKGLPPYGAIPAEPSPEAEICPTCEESVVWPGEPCVMCAP